MTLLVDAGYQLLATTYVCKQSGQLAEQLRGIRRSADIEYVHRARVASRRLRAAMRMFGDCFQPGQPKRWRKHIRRVTNSLGDARDKDVQIEFLCGVLDGLQERACYPGIVRLLAELEQRRERVQPKVIKAIDRLQASGVLDEMRAVARRVLADDKAAEVGVRSPVARSRTRQHILRNLKRMRRLSASLDDANNVRQHHAMRIAAKRLRYTMEISRPVYDERLDQPVAMAKKLQTLLGEIHDCDVWSQQLDEFARQQRKRLKKLYGHAKPFSRLAVGIEYLRQDRRDHRRKVFRELFDFWQELSRQGQWEELVATVQSQSDRCAKSRRSP